MTTFNEFFENFDLSDLSKIRITETFAIIHDSLFPKLTIYLHTIESAGGYDEVFDNFKNVN